jgi:hypothetical protein
MKTRSGAEPTTSDATNSSRKKMRFKWLSILAVLTAASGTNSIKRFRRVAARDNSAID